MTFEESEDFEIEEEYYPIATGEQSKELVEHRHTVFMDDPNIVFGTTLEKGKYDINYTIKLLTTILNQCDRMRMNPRDFQFTLQQSLQRLLAMIVTERNDYNLRK